MKLNRDAYQKLVAEDLDWLANMPRSLERDHIDGIVRQSADLYYSSKAAEAAGGQVCACAEVGRVYPFNGKHFCSNCKRQVITPNWRGFSDRVARLIWTDNSEAFPGMSSPEQVAANKTLNERQWKSISDLIFNEISAMAAPAAPSERADEREKFEAWAKTDGFPDADLTACGCQKKEPFHYEDAYTDFAHRAWQARAGLPSQEGK